MKTAKTYLSGKSVFIVSLLVIGITALTVYLTGINYNRTVTSNLYLSLGIIGSCLFVFISYGLYQGLGVIDDFTEEKQEESDNTFSFGGELPELPSVDVGDDFAGLILSIALWIVMAVFFAVILVLLEAIFWYSIFVISTMLYWIFLRALRMVFNKASETKGELGLSVAYSLGYTILFTGWIFGIAYLVETFN